MGLFDKIHEKQLLNDIVSRKSEAETRSHSDSRYEFGPLWTQEDKYGFFLSPYICERLFAKDAPYSKLIGAALENGSDSELAATLIHKIYGISPDRGQIIYHTAKKLCKDPSVNGNVRVPGIGELFLYYPSLPPDSQGRWDPREFHKA